MDELIIKFIYNGEKSLFNFVRYIKHNVEGKFDRNHWSGTIKIEDLIFEEKEKSFADILFKIYFTLQEKKNIPIEINLYYKP